VRRAGGTLQVIVWARLPRGAVELFNILETTRDDELVSLMTAVGGPSGRIAWAEYGRRKWGVDYGIEDRNAKPYMATGGPWH
jgi:hypothetical protein